MRELQSIAILVVTIIGSAGLQPALAQEPAERPCPRSQSAAAAVDTSTVPTPQAFFRAVLIQDLDTVRALLANGFDPKQADEYGNTALHWAAALDNKPIVDLLIGCGAAPDAPAALTGATPLIMAVDHEASGAMASLLEAGAQPSAAVSLNENNRDLALNGLDIAARRNRADLVSSLVEHGAQVASSTSHALRYAIMNKNAQLVRFLLERGARHPDMGASAPYSFLDDAVWRGDEEIVDALIAHGARTADSTKTLSSAAARASQRTFELVLQLRPDLNRYDANRETPLMAAARAGWLSAVEQLLAAGAQPLMLAQPPQGPDLSAPPRNIDLARTALSAAAESGSIEVLTRLAALPGFTCEMFGAALLAAASQPTGKDAATRELLLHYKQCFPKGSEVLSSAVLRAVEAHSLDSVQALLAAGASLTAVIDPRYGWAIHEPINPPTPNGQSWGRFPLIRIAGYAAVSPLELAIATRELEITSLLLEAGASLARDVKQTSAFHVLADPGGYRVFARAQGSLDALVALLLEKGAELDAYDRNGMTPLLRAAQWDDLELVDALLRAGANPQLKKREEPQPPGRFPRTTTNHQPGTAGLLRGELTLEQARAANAAARPQPSESDPLTQAVCVTQPQSGAAFSVGRNGLTVTHPRVPITPFAGYVSVDVTVDPKTTYPSQAARTQFREAILHSLAIWRMVCPNCAPRNLVVARVNDQLFMIDGCYREIRDLPNRKLRGTSAPRYGDPTTAFTPDASASCARRYGMGRMSGNNSHWQFVPLAKSDPVFQRACEAPEYADLNAALGCAKAASSTQAASVAKVALGFTHQDTQCAGAPDKVIACTQQHRRVDLNARDFVFELQGSAERFGSGKKTVDLSRVLLHEVGHWLGLDDREGGENIMSPRIRQARCIANQNVALLADPLNQAVSLHSGKVEALMDDRP